MPQRYLEAGQVVATQGLDGWLRIQPWCDSPEFLLPLPGLYFAPEGKLFRRFTGKRAQKSLLIAGFEGVENVRAAAALVRTVLYFDRESVTLPDGCYFEQDLLGLEAVDDETGLSYGKITEVGHAPSNDYYTVATPGGREVLIPAIRPVIKSVDLASGRMRITPLKGLFDDAD